MWKLQHRTAPLERNKELIFQKWLLDGANKIPENCSVVKFRKSHQNKTTSALKKWFHPFLVGCLPPGTIGYIDVDEQDGVRAQQNRGEGCTVQVNKRGDPCCAGKVVIKIKNKPSSLGPTCTSYTCQLAVTTLKSILRRKPVCRPVHNSLSIVYNAETRECGCII